MQGLSDIRRSGQLALAAADAAILVAAGFTAAWVRFGGGILERELGRILDHPGFIAYALLAQLVLAVTFDLYRPQSWRTRDYLLTRMAALGISLAVALALGTYFVLGWRFGRGLLAITLVISVTAQTVLRFAWYIASARVPSRRAVLIGEGPIVAELQQALAERSAPPFVIVRHLAASNGAQLDEISADDLADADLVIVAQLADEPTADRLAALNFRGTTVVDSAGAFAALTGRIPVRQVDSRWFIATGDFASLATTTFHNVQRFLDVFAATVLLLLSSPLLLAAAAAILLTDGPPVIYRQTRLGRFGRPFTLFKLRTMRRSAEKDGPRFSNNDDARVLAVGRLLRRWRIDELPQLVNVLRGEMSLVGPRPERPELAQQLEREIPFYAFRYSVRPGLTGWAQVQFPYCAETEEHLVKLEFDLYSLRHHGPAMYLMVLLRTLGALIFPPAGRGTTSE
jgi:lipopolysaccharide/colanic/teichoic acid biosynthesis glycosyltransferase